MATTAIGTAYVVTAPGGSYRHGAVSGMAETTLCGKTMTREWVWDRRMATDEDNFSAITCARCCRQARLIDGVRRVMR